MSMLSMSGFLVGQIAPTRYQGALLRSGTLPLGCLALGGVEPGARQRDLDPPKGPDQRSRAVTVAVAGDLFWPIAILDTLGTRKRNFKWLGYSPM
jgi:hypothetical protein